MRGLPDSAIYGTYKRLKGAGGRKRTSEVGWEDFFLIVNAVKRYRARRAHSKARQSFYEKHGYYKQ